MKEEPRVNVLCIKWGNRYDASFVNRLFTSVKLNLTRPFRFVCVTDNKTGLLPEIESVPFPEDPGMPRAWPNIFVKLLIFKDGFANLSGPTLFLDIDVVITGNLDCFFDYKPGEYCIIHNWVECYKYMFKPKPHIGNSSCFRFDAGKSNDVYEVFMNEKNNPEFEWKFQKGSQKFQTYAMEKNGRKVFWWEDEWVRSFKRHSVPIFPLNLFLTPRLPKNTRILAFHGKPDPDVAVSGYKNVKLHLITRPAPWINDFWNRIS